MSKTQVRKPPNIEQKLDELVKLAEKYGVAAMRGDLALAQDLMSRIKSQRAEIVRDIETNGGALYVSGVEDGRSSR